MSWVLIVLVGCSLFRLYLFRLGHGVLLFNYLLCLLFRFGLDLIVLFCVFVLLIVLFVYILA